MTARKRVKEMMQQMGFQVVEAKDGVEGINKLEELSQVYGESLNDTLKIIVSDVEMPQMDGFHFAARIKEDPRFKDIPIIFNSSLSNEFMNEKGVQEAGGEGYLVNLTLAISSMKLQRLLKNINLKNRGKIWKICKKYLKTFWLKLLSLLSKSTMI